MLITYNSIITLTISYFTCVRVNIILFLQMANIEKKKKKGHASDDQCSQLLLV